MKNNQFMNGNGRGVNSLLGIINRSVSDVLRARGITSTNKQRRGLASILYADVSNYTKHCEEDEEGTHDHLIKLMDLFSGEIQYFHGKLIHSEGDAVLAEFSDVESVLKCAISVQNKVPQVNALYPPERRIEFRIGVNLGEVIYDRGDIYGNAVNVAARLESLADPGGITVSDSVRVIIGNRLAAEFVSLGDQLVKNISRPIRAYHLEIKDSGIAIGDSNNVVPFPMHTDGELLPR
jgi:adenylate cyclase